MKIKCETCDGLKDKRAKKCIKCHLILNPPRRGTGVEKRLSTNGYICIMRNNKEIYEHRAIMEDFIGRPLRSDEHVHHINHDKTDNRLENLELKCASEHRRQHATEQHAIQRSRLGFGARLGFSMENKNA